MFQSSNVIFPVSRNCVTISASCCIIAMFGEWRIHVLGLTRERDPLRVGRISQGRIFWPRICSLCRIAFLLSHVQHHICFLPPRLILTDLPLAKMKTSTQISVKKQTTGLKNAKNARFTLFPSWISNLFYRLHVTSWTIGWFLWIDQILCFYRVSDFFWFLSAF